MEVVAGIGLAASAMTLLKASKGLCDLARRFPRALDEANEFKESLARIHSQTGQIHRLGLSLGTIDCAWSAEDKASVISNINQGELHLRSIEALFKKLTAGSNIRRRWRWIFTDSKHAEKVAQKLTNVEVSLTLTLGLLSFYSRLQDHGLLKKIDLDLSSLLAQSQGLPAPTTPSEIAIEKPEIAFEVAQEAGARQGLFRLWRNGSKDTVSERRCAVSLSKRVQDWTSDYVLAARVRLLFNRMIVLNVSWRRYWNDRLTISILKGSSLSIVRFVAADGEFMTACRRGDNRSMRRLLESGQASVRDVTTGNYGPMGLAVEAGSTKAIRTLLHFGADVDTVFGRNQTSVLAWAIRWRRKEIVRLLLSQRVSCEYVSSHGWTPLWYIWDVAEPNQASSTELIEMLAAHGDFNLSHEGVIDEDGAGLIHRAVCFGTAEEVDMLVRVGVSPFTTEGPLAWTAIHNAVFEGKLDIFEILLPYYRHIHIDTPDTRGWTLLHISASAGQSAITRRLLELSADPSKKSTPSFTHMPEQLYGGCWTPAEVARAQNEERWLDMLRATRDFVGEKSLTVEESKALNENEWFDAYEVQ